MLLRAIRLMAYHPLCGFAVVENVLLFRSMTSASQTSCASLLPLFLCYNRRAEVEQERQKTKLARKLKSSLLPQSMSFHTVRARSWLMYSCMHGRHVPRSDHLSSSCWVHRYMLLTWCLMYTRGCMKCISTLVCFFCAPGLFLVDVANRSSRSADQLAFLPVATSPNTALSPVLAFYTIHRPLTPAQNAASTDFFPFPDDLLGPALGASFRSRQHYQDCEHPIPNSPSKMATNTATHSLDRKSCQQSGTIVLHSIN